MPLALVLSVGLDSPVLVARNVLLQSAGYIVVSAFSLKEAVHRFLTGNFDLVLLDNSLPTKDRDRLTCLVRLSGSRIPIVALAPEYSHDDSFADARIEGDPNKLLIGIRGVLHKAATTAADVSKTGGKDQRPRDPAKLAESRPSRVGQL
jgi:CheY-like chemotaxis protein